MLCFTLLLPSHLCIFPVFGMDGHDAHGMAHGVGHGARTHLLVVCRGLLNNTLLVDGTLFLLSVCMQHARIYPWQVRAGRRERLLTDDDDVWRKPWQTHALRFGWLQTCVSLPYLCLSFPLSISFTKSFCHLLPLTLHTHCLHWFAHAARRTYFPRRTTSCHSLLPTSNFLQPPYIT